MEPGIAELRKNYERFNDDKLIRLATEQATMLRPEALDVLKQVIKERGLSENINSGIEAQLRVADEASLLEYCNLLRNLSCPVCNSSSFKLNATITGTVVSFIVFTNYEKKLVIACPNCLNKQNNDALTKSLLFGWWGIPWGIVRTIQALIFNTKMQKQNNQMEANDVLKSFVRSKVGKIEMNKNNQKELQSLIMI